MIAPWPTIKGRSGILWWCRLWLYAGPFVESGQAALEVPPTTTGDIRVGSTGGPGWRCVVPRSTEENWWSEYPLLPLLMKPFAGEIGTSQVPQGFNQAV